MNNLRFPKQSDSTGCSNQGDNIVWVIHSNVSNPIYSTVVGTDNQRSGACFLTDICNDDDCMNVLDLKIVPETSEEFLACNQQVADSGFERDFTCF